MHGVCYERERERDGHQGGGRSSLGDCRESRPSCLIYHVLAHLKHRNLSSRGESSQNMIIVDSWARRGRSKWRGWKGDTNRIFLVLETFD